MRRRMKPSLEWIGQRVLELATGGRRSRNGQDLIEYALLIGFIAVACAAFIPYTATETMRTIYSRIADILASSTNPT